MNRKLMQEAIAALEEQRVKIDMAVAGLQAVLAMYPEQAPNPPFKDAKVVETPKAPVRVAYSEPKPPPKGRDFSIDRDVMKLWLAGHGLTQEKAAKILGVPTWKVAFISSGRQKLDDKAREAMARYDKEHPAKAQEPQRQPGPTFRPVP